MALLSDKILKYLLPVFFVLLAFGEILKFRFKSSAAVGLIDIIILVIVFIWFIFVRKSNYFLRNAFVTFVIVALFSLVINIVNFPSSQLLISSLYLIRFMLYGAMYFVFVDIGKEYRDRIPKYMFLVGFIFLVLGLLQYFIFPSLKPYYNLGWDMHTYRIFSTFLDPNFAGTFLVLILIFTFVLRDKIFPKKYFFTFYIFLILNFIGIALTYSRGAMLMLLTCVVSYSAITRNWKLTIGIIISFILVFFILSSQFTKLESTNLLRFASVEARIQSSKTALYIWQKNPLGVGFNTYRYARENYGDKDIYYYGPSHAGAGVDNSFILVLVTTGIIGLVAYLYLIYKIFRLGIDNVKKNKFAIVLTISLVGIAVNALTINSLFYSFILIWIFILAGFTESSLRE